MDGSDNTGQTAARPVEEAASSTAQKRPPRRRGTPKRWAIVAVALLVMCATIVWLLPSLLVVGPWRNSVLAWVMSDLHGSIYADRVRLGWFSPVEVSGLRLRDSSGSPLLELDQFRTEKTLLQLLGNRHDFGPLHLRGPKVTVIIEQGTTNWQQALAEYLKPSGQPWPSLRLEVSGGTVQVIDRTFSPPATESYTSDGEPTPTSAQQAADPTSPAGTNQTAGAVRKFISSAGGKPGVSPKPAGQLAKKAPNWSCKLDDLNLSLVLAGGSTPGVAAELRCAVRYGPQRGQVDASCRFGTLVEAESTGKQGPSDRPGDRTSLVAGSVEASPEPHTAPQRHNGVQPANDRSEAPAGATNLLRVSVTGFPLQVLRALATLCGCDMQLEGVASGRLLCRWQMEKDASAWKLSLLDVRPAFSVEHLLIGGQVLGGGCFATKRLDASGRLLWQDERVELDRLLLAAGENRFSASGVVPLGALRWPLDPAELLAEPLDVRGQVDLAQLADQLPRLLRLRHDARIKSGRLQLACSTRLPDGRPGWTASIQVDRLHAEAAGKPLVWEKPLALHLSARPSQSGPWQYGLAFQSDFLNMQAAGTVQNASGSAQFQLRRLVEQFGQVIDFGNFQLAGDGWMQFRWECIGPNGYVGDVRLNIDNWNLTLPSGGQWSEPQLHATAHLEAELKESGAVGPGEPSPGVLAGNTLFSEVSALRVQSAAVSFRAGGDQLSLQLSEPLALGEKQPLVLRAESTGRIEHWLARAASLVPVHPWDAAGSYRADATVRLEGDRFSLEHLALQATGVQITGPAIELHEPQLELAARGRWRWDQRSLELQSARLSSSAINAVAEAVTWNMQQGEGGGTARFACQLEPLVSWLRGAQGKRSNLQLAGGCTGSLRFRHTRQGGELVVDLSGKDIRWQGSIGQPIHEPEIRLLARAKRTAGQQRWDIEQLQLWSTSLAASASGWVDPTRKPAVCHLEGQADYHWDRLRPLMSRYVPTGVVLSGKGEGSFAWSGPLDATVANGHLAAGWSSGNIYGFPLGPAKMQLVLGEGMLRLEPLRVAVSQGQANLAGTVHLASRPRLLQVQTGRVLDRVHISPRMCAAALGYVAPPLAGVTRAEGTFSLELDACTIPIEQPEKGQLSGRLIIHSIQIAAGPLIQALAQLHGRSATARLRSESVVPFEMVDGRIYHRDLELVFPEVTIRTSGSVGLDRSLSLLVEMPVPAKLRTGRPVIDALLDKQKIQLPVAGTLQRPTIDDRALGGVVRNAIRQATQNMLQDGVPGLLENLRRRLEQQEQ